MRPICLLNLTLLFVSRLAGADELDEWLWQRLAVVQDCARFEPPILLNDQNGEWVVGKVDPIKVVTRQMDPEEREILRKQDVVPAGGFVHIVSGELQELKWLHPDDKEPVIRYYWREITSGFHSGPVPPEFPVFETEGWVVCK